MHKLARFKDDIVITLQEKIDLLTSDVGKGSQGVLVSSRIIEEIFASAFLPENIQILDGCETLLDENKNFVSRYDYGVYLSEVIKHCGVIIDEDVNFWTWISAVYIRQLCKKKSDTHYILNSSYRYVYDNSRFRYYRHLSRQSWVLAHKFQKHSLLFLNRPMFEGGDITEQLQKDMMISSHPLIEMCIKYFYIHEKRKFKSGFQATNPRSPGSLRRLVQAVAPQLYVNYDLFVASPESIYSLLPEDFKV